MLEKSQLEGVRVVGGHVYEALDRCHQGHVFDVAVSILSQIGTVLLFCGHTSDLLHPLVDAEVLTAVTAIVSIRPGAID